MTPDDIARIKAYCEKATAPELWHPVITANYWNILDKPSYDADSLFDDEEYAEAEDNAQFVCAARTDLPALLAAYEKLLAENAAADRDIADLIHKCDELRGHLRAVAKNWHDSITAYDDKMGVYYPKCLTDAMAAAGVEP